MLKQENSMVSPDYCVPGLCSRITDYCSLLAGRWARHPPALVLLSTLMLHLRSIDQSVQLLDQWPVHGVREGLVD